MILHLLIELEVAVLFAQDAVKEFIKEDEAILRLDSHLENLCCDLCIVHLGATKRLRYHFEEVLNLASLKLDTAIFNCAPDPGCSDYLIITIKQLQRAILG